MNRLVDGRRIIESMFQSIAQKFKEKVLPAREKLFGVKNIMAAPKIEKVVLNARIKRGGQVTEEMIVSTIQRITGQKPIVAKARKSISNFKIREGMPVGVKVTLRGRMAFNFLDKLINITLPRVRDFSGLSEKNIDAQGNLNIGLREHIVFPEAASDDISKMHGLQITVKTTAGSKDKALILLKELGFPFKK